MLGALLFFGSVPGVLLAGAAALFALKRGRVGVSVAVGILALLSAALLLFALGGDVDSTLAPG